MPYPTEVPVKVWAPEIIQAKAKTENVAPAMRPGKKPEYRWALPGWPPSTRNSGTSAIQTRKGVVCKTAK